MGLSFISGLLAFNFQKTEKNYKFLPTVVHIPRTKLLLAAPLSIITYYSVDSDGNLYINVSFDEFNGNGTVFEQQHIYQSTQLATTQEKTLQHYFTGSSLFQLSQSCP